MVSQKNLDDLVEDDEEDIADGPNESFSDTIGEAINSGKLVPEATLKQDLEQDIPSDWEQREFVPLKKKPEAQKSTNIPKPSVKNNNKHNKQTSSKGTDSVQPKNGNKGQVVSTETLLNYPKPTTSKRENEQRLSSEYDNRQKKDNKMMNSSSLIIQNNFYKKHLIYLVDQN